MSKTRVGVVGYRGYSGAELVHILGHHAHAEPILLEHRSDAEVRPLPKRHHRPKTIPSTVEAAHGEGLALVFLATPHEVAMELAPPFLDGGIKVVDLSAAFRLGKPETYRRWYGHDHTAPKYLDEAAYGLPEFYREQIKTARLVANPGCYPTAANLAIRPLLSSDIADRQAGIVCDAKSGVSGAGRKPTLKTAYCEVTENFSAYSILSHRHVPEVLMNSNLTERDFSFTAHLIPCDRGILETIYFRTSRRTSAADIVDMYERAYDGEPFVRVYEPGVVPDLHAVRRTNYCDIGVKVDSDTGRGVVVICIDNLVKGAAGQAVQNMNLVLGFRETEGLL